MHLSRRRTYTFLFALAIAAVGIGGCSWYILKVRSAYFERPYPEHARMEGIFRRDLKLFPKSPKFRQMANYHTRMKQEYERVIRKPWLRLRYEPPPFDPPTEAELDSWN